MIKYKGTSSSHAIWMELRKNCDETRFSFPLLQLHVFVISLILIILLLLFNNNTFDLQKHLCNGNLTVSLQVKSSILHLYLKEIYKSM